MDRESKNKNISIRTRGVTNRVVQKRNIKKTEKKISRYSTSRQNAYYFQVLLIYLEIVFHIAMFKRLDWSLIYPVLFALPAGFILSIVTNFFTPKINHRIVVGITAALCLIFCAEVVYHGVFNTYFSLFSMMGVANQGADFFDIIVSTIFQNLSVIIFLLVPVFVIAFFGFMLIDFRKKILEINVLYIILAIVLSGFFSLVLMIGKDKMYSAYDLYHNQVSVDMSINKLGVFATTYLDAKFTFVSESKKNRISYVSKTAKAQETTDTSLPADNIHNDGGLVERNIMNIDFDRIINNAPNDTVKYMSEYFKAQSGTYKNQYTGKFKGYNLIFLTAEGFSKYVVDPVRTPTLYKMVNQGFVFENYYTPLWYGSTSGGEYVNLTGMPPVDGGVLCMKETGERQSNMLFTLGKQLSKLGYTTQAYHNNTYTYYGRDKSHPNMGYNWVGVGNGYEPEVSEYGDVLWPQSDLKLIDDTVPQYIGKQPFHTYYMTVSGHVVYAFGNNAMARRNRETVENLPYSETTKAYLACNMELEKALTSLVNQLTAAGVADKTLIVLSADHVPYDNKEVCDELAGHVLEDEFEFYENNLIIWSASMKEPIKVDKYCSSIDILPTISNLMSLEYDSRLMTGQDILSDSEPLVIFKTRSWISDKCMYNAQTGQITSLTGEEITMDYINAVNKIVREKFDIADMVFEQDYYKYVDPALN